jgi:uncharacterized protein DUF2304
VTVAGVVVFDVFGLAVLLWLLDSVRRGRLYVGYGVILIGLLVGVVSAVSVPALRSAAAEELSALFPAAPVAVVGFALVALLLIYVLGQLTILSNRLAQVIQELALKEARQYPSHRNDENRPRTS